jgi:hypothetical protein
LDQRFHGAEHLIGYFVQGHVTDLGQQACDIGSQQVEVRGDGWQFHHLRPGADEANGRALMKVEIDSGLAGDKRDGRQLRSQPAPNQLIDIPTWVTRH